MLPYTKRPWPTTALKR